MSTPGPITVFISYNHGDGWTAAWLAEGLGKFGIKVWIDQEGMRTGDDIYHKVEAAIATSQFFLILLTENSVKSDWVQKELAIAIERYKHDELLILPVRAGPVTLPKSLKGLVVLELSLEYQTASLESLVRDIQLNFEERFGERPAEEPVASGKVGTVKWFNDAKGFGFITQDGGGEDVFAHHRGVDASGFRRLAEGQKVEFDITRGPKSLQAQNVRRIK
jgi:CspA family cold shock protein